MNIILDFCKEFIYQIIFTVVLSTGFVVILKSKIKGFVNLKSVGITYVHRRGKDVKSMIKAMTRCQKLYIIAFMPYSLIFDNRELLTKKIKDGCNIKVLVGNPNSDILKELCQIENGTGDDISSHITQVKNLLQNIKKDAGSESTGTVEVRTYNTEIRNPAIVCFTPDNNKSAFLTISLPPKRSIDSMMVEYNNAECEDVITYFESIWERHPNDTILKV